MIKTLGQKLKEIRTHFNMSISEFAKNLGTSARAYTSYEYDERKPSYEFYFNLRSVFSVNLNWLIANEGSMFINICDNSHIILENPDTENDFKNWGKRLSQILSENEETSYNFSKKTGIKESRIEKFILDSVEPTMSEINAIKNNVDISLDWLFYNEFVDSKNTQTENISLSTNDILQVKQLLKILKNNSNVEL